MIGVSNIGIQHLLELSDTHNSILRCLIVKSKHACISSGSMKEVNVISPAKIFYLNS
jgi:hypothetical protein